MHILIHRYGDTAIFESRYTNDDVGCAADAPKGLLKIVLLASSRGRLSARRREHACREHVPFMALACGRLPAHRTRAAFVSSMKEEILSLCRDSLLVWEEQG